MARAIEKLSLELSNLAGVSDHRHREISSGLLTRETINQVASQSDKLDRIERTVNSFQSQISNLQGAVKDSHLSMTEGLPKHMSDSKSLYPDTTFTPIQSPTTATMGTNSY